VDTDPPWIDIRRLVDVPQVAPFLRAWLLDEWESWYGPDGPGDIDAAYPSHMSGNTFPTALVAVDETGAVVGTICLREQSSSHLEFNPWVGGLLVARDRRRQGIGSALVKAAEDEARRLGVRKLYLETHAAASVVVRRGWIAVAPGEPADGPAMVYALDL
jgi:GNAT superfamily N-acetyltransferase